MRTGERQSYATAIAGLWSGLSRTLDRLERIAAEPAETLADPDELDAIPRLQYTLHAASEAAAGIAPPADAETSHAELAAALADARESRRPPGRRAHPRRRDRRLPRRDLRPLGARRRRPHARRVRRAPPLGV